MVEARLDSIGPVRKERVIIFSAGDQPGNMRDGQRVPETLRAGKYRRPFFEKRRNALDMVFGQMREGLRCRAHFQHRIIVDLAPLPKKHFRHPQCVGRLTGNFLAKLDSRIEQFFRWRGAADKSPIHCRFRVDNVAGVK